MDSIKTNWISFAITFYFLTITTQIQSSDILVIFPTTAQSHYRVVRPLIHGLLDRGHKILTITNFPDVNEKANLSQINISSIKPHSKFNFKKFDNTAFLNIVLKTPEKFNDYATILDHPLVVKLLQSNRKFDLVIAEYFTTTSMFVPISTIVDAPIVGICPMITFPMLHELMGMENTLSYMPSLFNNFFDYSFFERLKNVVISILRNIIFNWYYFSRIQEITKKYYGLQDNSQMQLLSNISLILTNNYHSMLMTLPTVPGIVEIGGIHVEDEKPLPQELNDFINSADHGVILFSLGSVISESSLDKNKLNHIINTFSKLKQKVIWKFDIEGYKTLLPNVKIVKWFPQRDLLAHPKVLLFISHAGIMSVIETVHCGKPMVAIPFLGDQPFNANFLVEKKVAVTIDFKHLTSDIFLNAINEVLTEKYKNNAKKLQELYNDRPQSPLETAIFWTEYVIRYKNQSKELLKTPRIHLNVNQTYLIDVFATLTLPIIIIIVIIFWAMNNLRKN